METQQASASAPEKIFRVKSATASTDLGSAIAHAVREGNEVVLRAVGAGAINQAVKSVPIAKSFVASFGMHLLCDITFFHGQAQESSVGGPAQEKDILGVAIRVLPR